MIFMCRAISVVPSVDGHVLADDGREFSFVDRRNVLGPGDERGLQARRRTRTCGRTAAVPTAPAMISCAIFAFCIRLAMTMSTVTES